jgi:hypothetical protein
MSGLNILRVLLCTLLISTLLSGCASLKDLDMGGILEGPGQGALDEATVVAGLKEALKVGSTRATDRTSRAGGFLENDLIRIPLPDQLDPVASTLRQVGLGSYVDELETAMNRAAEKAAGEAAQVFWNAVTTMTIADAFTILEGHETAATEYFRSRTEGDLRRRFQPIVSASTEEVGLGRLYGDLARRYEAIPLTGKPELVDLDTYVTDRALDGLFTVLAQEEQTIREDPVARTTELLRRVFGN